MAYQLLDAFDRYIRAPLTFELPSSEWIQRLAPGWFAKLDFLYPNRLPNGCEGERMWVRITKRNGDTFEGVLANNPLKPELCGTNFGETVSFGTKHVIDVEEPAPETPTARAR